MVDYDIIVKNTSSLKSWNYQVTVLTDSNFGKVTQSVASFDELKMNLPNDRLLETARAHAAELYKKFTAEGKMAEVTDYTLENTDLGDPDEDEAVCPWCDRVMDLDSATRHRFADFDGEIVDCEYCGKPVRVRSQKIVRYATAKPAQAAMAEIPQYAGTVVPAPEED